MDKHTSSENIPSWIRAASAAIGVLLLSVFVLSNSENEKSSTLTQEARTKEMRNLANLSPDQAESEEKLTVEIQANSSPDQAESEEKTTVEIQKLQYRH